MASDNCEASGGTAPAASDRAGCAPSAGAEGAAPPCVAGCNGGRVVAAAAAAAAASAVIDLGGDGGDGKARAYRGAQSIGDGSHAACLSGGSGGGGKLEGQCAIAVRQGASGGAPPRRGASASPRSAMLVLGDRPRDPLRGGGLVSFGISAPKSARGSRL